ncbi:RagB/SusD family nutrient uptake outer membrane protein [Phocaeicola sp.]|uniref:RagB/SusD family nutrient uptake outer membrane protein n=1 Tax=Phocaeicola sp. TaxID=2773926 RepID=UPI003AB769F2
MKQIKYIVFGAFSLLTMVTTSCNNFLEEEPLDLKTDGQFWTSDADAQSAVNMVYSGGVPYLYGGRNTGWQPTRLMYNGLLSGLFTDDKKDGDFSANMETLNINFQTVAGDVGELWREPYVSIGRCNVLAQRLPQMVQEGIISEDRKNELMAQVYFFRAWSYFFLIKEFGCKDGEAAGGGNGGVPLVLEPYETTNPDVINKPRASIVTVYEQIEKDLKEAIKYLPNTTFYENGCRITRPAAQALLASVYLQWAGYPLQNTAKYAEAATMAENIINGNSGHTLEQSDDDGTNQQSAFNKIKNDKTSKEIIYAIEYDEALNQGNPYINSCMTNQATTWVEDDKSKVFATSVLANMYHASNVILDSYVDGDVRMKEKNFFFTTYISKSGKVFQCNQYDNWFWFEDYAMINSKGSSLNFPVFRLAEVYLIAAEALLKQATPNPDKARNYVAEVRKRAFTVNGILNDNYSLPDPITIDDVLTERLHELPLELKVWDDIRRTHLYPQLQSDNSLKWVDISTAETYNKRDNKTFKNNLHMLLWPIPQSAMERNPNLTQNPGY